MPHSLFQLVKAPLKANPRNSVIGFHDNSSAIRRALGLPCTAQGCLPIKGMQLCGVPPVYTRLPPHKNDAMVWGTL